MMIVFKQDSGTYKEHQVASVSDEEARQYISDGIAQRYDDGSSAGERTLRDQRYMNRMMRSR